MCQKVWGPALCLAWVAHACSPFETMGCAARSWGVRFWGPFPDAGCCVWAASGGLALAFTRLGTPTRHASSGHSSQTAAIRTGWGVSCAAVRTSLDTLGAL